MFYKTHKSYLFALSKLRENALFTPPPYPSSIHANHFPAILTDCYFDKLFVLTKNTPIRHTPSAELQVRDKQSNKSALPSETLFNRSGSSSHYLYPDIRSYITFSILITL